MLHFEVIPGEFWVFLAGCVLAWLGLRAYVRVRRAKHLAVAEHNYFRNIAHSKAWQMFRGKPKQLRITDRSAKRD